MEKLHEFSADGASKSTEFVENVEVCEGVSCDVYRFMDDSSKDLAIVTVQRGHTTPLQRVLAGSKTIEGFVEGTGNLSVRRADGTIDNYPFQIGDTPAEVEVKVGDIMQWRADGEADLVFYEICEPPYQDGRFENLAE